MCDAEVHGPGPFRCPLRVNWFYEGEYHVLALSVRGTGAPPEGKSRETTRKP